MGVRSAFAALLAGLFRVFQFAETCFNERMAQCRRQLRAAYRFPGFVPSAEVPGFFGAPQARSAGLRRRRKDGLRPVGNAVAQFLRSTSLGGGALCPAACGTSPWSLRSGGVACPHCGVKREKRDGLADNPCSMRNGWPIPSADAVGTRRSRPAPKNWMGIGRRSRSWTNSRCARSCAGGGCPTPRVIGIDAVSIRTGHT